MTNQDIINLLNDLNEFDRDLISDEENKELDHKIQLAIKYLKQGGEKMKYRLKDNQIDGRYFGVDVIFNSKQEIEDTLRETLMDDDVDVSLIPLWELLEMADYEIEEIREGSVKAN